MKAILIALIFLLISACSNSVSKETSDLKKLLAEQGVSLKPGRSAYVIYSDKGCGACVKITRNFIASNILKNDALFCVVSSTPEKVVNIHFSQQIQKRKNFLNDRSGVFANYVALSPKILFVENGDVEAVADVSYSNAEGLFLEVLMYLQESNATTP